MSPAGKLRSGARDCSTEGELSEKRGEKQFGGISIQSSWACDLDMHSRNRGVAKGWIVFKTQKGMNLSIP
jgi:hypothetical protein